jgi:hypothetical protein
MLKVTTTADGAKTTLQLEGRLAGPWVGELERCWRRIASGQAVTVLLQAVTFIDESGKALLIRMYRSGAELLGEGCMTKAIVEQIRAQHPQLKEER